MAKCLFPSCFPHDASGFSNHLYQLLLRPRWHLKLGRNVWDRRTWWVLVHQPKVRVAEAGCAWLAVQGFQEKPLHSPPLSNFVDMAVDLFLWGGASICLILSNFCGCGPAGWQQCISQDWFKYLVHPPSQRSARIGQCGKFGLLASWALNSTRAEETPSGEAFCEMWHILLYKITTPGLGV